MEGLLFLMLWQIPMLGRFLNSQKDQADFLISVIVNSGPVLYLVVLTFSVKILGFAAICTCTTSVLLCSVSTPLTILYLV